MRRRRVRLPQLRLLHMGGTDSNGGRHLRMNFPLLLLLFPLLDITSSGLGWRNPN
jgi:hypothetical protein